MTVTEKSIDEQVVEIGRRLVYENAAAAALAGLKDKPLATFLSNEWVKAMAHGTGLPDARYVRHVLDFANRGQLSRPAFVELLGGASLVADLPDGAGTVVVSAEMMGQLRDRLTILASRKATDIRKLSKELRVELVGQVVQIPTFPGSVMLALDTKSALAYALSRIVENTDIGGRLCRCDYSECGKFFLVEREHVHGRTRRNYCNESHRIEGTKAKARARTARWRQEPKKARKAK